MAKKGSTVTSSTSVDRSKAKNKTASSSLRGVSQSGDANFDSSYIPNYFGKGGDMKQCEQEMDWNTYMNKPMSLQHKIIAKLKMFADTRFDIVILGNSQVKNKALCNMIYKCFLDPLGKEIEDHIGESYAGGRAAANLTINLDNSEDTKMIKDMLAIKEDKIRYTQISVLKAYGLGLRFHIAGSIDTSEKIAASVAQQQIIVAANYLNFKKRYKSGFGMNTFLLILDNNGKLSKVTNCLIELLVSIFTVEVFNSLLFLIEITDETEENKVKLVNEAKSNISQKACCKPDLVHIFPIRPISNADKKQLKEETEEVIEETKVSATLKILNEVARQTYIDPNPFEPEGMDYHDALAVIDLVKKKYQPKEKEWYNIINYVYTMIPN